MEPIRTAREISFRPVKGAVFPKKAREWDRWVMALIATIVLEGAVRKWVLPPSMHAAVYGAKDIVLVLMLIRLSGNILSRMKTSVFQVGALLVSLLVIPGIAGAFEYSLGAVQTAKHALLWPLGGIVLGLSMPEAAERRIARMMCYITLPMAVLSVIQFYAAPSAPINQYAWGEVDRQFSVAVMPGTGFVRATGTFSFISGLGWFAVFAAIVALRELPRGQTRTDRRLAVATLLAAGACVLTTGSRAPALLIVFSLGIYLMFSNIRALAVLLVASVPVLLAAEYLAASSELIGAFITRNELAGDSLGDRFVDPIDLFVDYLVENPFGRGLGAQSQVLTHRIGQESGGATQVFVEDGRSRAVVEGGVFALLSLLTWMVFYLQQIVNALRLTVNVRVGCAVLASFGLYCAFVVYWYDHVQASFVGLANLLLVSDLRRGFLVSKKWL